MKGMGMEVEMEGEGVAAPGGAQENPAMMVAQGLQQMAETAPSPEIRARLEKIMAELGDIATMMEGGEPMPQAPGAGGQSPVRAQQGTPV